jgi:fluoride ion exporter CrcB/FEX
MLIFVSYFFSFNVSMYRRMMKFNLWRPSFPIGTFACNITACALSGTLGTLIAGNPGPRESITLVAIVAGFGGTLSSVARFIVEIIAGMDPVLFRLDGLMYAVSSVFWGVLVSFLFSASPDWADETQSSTDDVESIIPSFFPSIAPTAIPSMSPTTMSPS